ncbi:unnamed protein product [Timema podura]|uniref:phytanoyl-CoA dioxygenase n=1 Tax=Timema podura TaxID=61482 RepID=A0ABN7NM11_TIMPD|nr:unnamed protein product [Timema podura]
MVSHSVSRFLSKEQVEFYKENGFVKFGDVFTNEEFDRFDKEYTYLFENKLNTFGNELESKWLGKEMDELANNKPTTVKSIHNLQFHSGVFNDVVNNKNLLDALEDVMDTPNILLHHTKAHLKPPEKGAPYLMHQEKFPLSKATPVSAKRGEVVIFSYLLIHGSYANSSKDRVRRMFLIQLMSADDEPIEDTHKSPGQGTVLRGRNKNRLANMDTRFVH